MGRKPTSGGVRPRDTSIELRFTFNGARVSPHLDLKPTAANMKHAVRLRAQIVEEIRLGTFNMAEHFPDFRNLAALGEGEDTRTRTVLDWFGVWKRHAARTLEHSSLAVYERHMNAYWLPVFGHLEPHKVKHEMVLDRLTALSKDRMDLVTGKVSKPLGRKTQNNILIPLRAVFELICKPPSRLSNPVDGINNQKVQKGQPDPFAPDEVALILQDIRRRDGDAWADYFEFSIFAGLRASEQIALLWQDVDLRSGKVMVRRSRVLNITKDRTKTHVERLVELNARAAAVIQRQRARTQARGREVFHHPGLDGSFHDEQSQRRVWTLALRAVGVRYRPPKECRDTSVTLALMAGANPMWVALQHGHSVQVMMRDYAKWIPSADRGANLAAVNASLGVAPKAGFGAG